tara:strand:+ start:433 stop:1077 length:645 start_codon:yes stop_codon:yes gene_type:complete
MDKFDDQWFNDYDNMAHEIEVHITTLEGSQHLRLSGYLKHSSILIKAETIANSEKEGIFGKFMIYPTRKQLEALKKENRKNDLYSELETITNEDGRWNLHKKDIQYYDPNENMQKLDEGIKDFLLNLSLSTPKDLTKWIEQANNISIELFKKSPSYITEYIETNELNNDEKIKDIDMMINFYEEKEQYENCAFLIKIKEKVQKRQLLLKIQNNE